VVFPLHGARLPGGFFSAVDKDSDPKDRIVEWIKPQRSEVMDLEEYSKLPKSILVREVKVNGRYFVTTLLDRKKYSRFAIAELYKMRYGSIKVDLRSIKDVMQLDFLRCLKPDMVKKEIWMHILGYNLVRYFMNQAAHQFKKIPRQLSFKTAMQTIGSHCISLMGAGKELFIHGLLGLLKIISFVKVGVQQKEAQPRAVKRRKKCLALLTIPRKLAKKRLKCKV